MFANNGARILDSLSLILSHFLDRLEDFLTEMSFIMMSWWRTKELLDAYKFANTTNTIRMLWTTKGSRQYVLTQLENELSFCALLCQLILQLKSLKLLVWKRC